MDQVSTVTIYDGTVFCRKCGAPMTPLEVLYSDSDVCPHCRNEVYEKHAKKLTDAYTI